MSRLFYFLTVAVVACGTSSERPIVAPMTPAPAPIAPSEEPPGDVRIDGIALGAPVRELLALEPFHAPCDVDAIDHKQRTLYFWAGGTCPQASPFPDATTVVVLTPRAKDVPHGDQPITLVAWSGPYFDKRTTLPVRVGDKRTDAERALGKAVCARVTVSTENGQKHEAATCTWDRVHAYFVDGVIAVLAIGELTADSDEESAATLERLYAHHLRYVGTGR
ncbi:MAG TPA: hypothetical protein PKL24_21785 [Polyangiaceae bacterium]|nr:MAG: hypothetical protein BWY17_03261 [Deltaproteobacteria bacterium ADurb.Bin207]HNZ24792.1 hypothetical protein [Polyangiaceae bacterium]HOD25076.1 hypothetical protein [Polyangiaceae bacterium]HOH02847.1 hypothetical protein [Polyangiaceae bacterium]HOR37189.1 hypothetical protein [Polyangiaceae bacterium]